MAKHTPRNFHPVNDYAREILASADPFYRGPHDGTSPRIAERVRPLDPAKTAHDLGRDTEAHDRDEGHDAGGPTKAGGPLGSSDGKHEH